MIFVSIASYRDPQLAPTIRDCLWKARYPRDLVFGICWQHDHGERLSVLGDRQFRVVDVNWRASQGACWARAEIMRLWNGEDYFLQLDSHHRFAKDWDMKLLRHIEEADSPRPIITTYAPPFSSSPPTPLWPVAMQMNFKGFTPDGIPVFLGAPVPNWRTLARPLRARFVSAGFLFTVSEFVCEVPYDPDLYFIGEEIAITIRAFTRGFDFFHPYEPILWHEYGRKGQAHHWDDHVAAAGVETEWRRRDSVSKAKVLSLWTERRSGVFGCGTMRSCDEYEAYTGLNLRQRYAEAYTRQQLEPPKPFNPLG
jgi:hypothetical protein